MPLVSRERGSSWSSFVEDDNDILTIKMLVHVLTVANQNNTTIYMTLERSGTSGWCSIQGLY